ATGHPSHQGVIILFDGNNGTPLMLFDAEEITAIRTAAASALATKLLANEDASTLAIIGAGEQAERHIESIPLVRPIKTIRLWGRHREKAEQLARKANLLAATNITTNSTTSNSTNITSVDPNTPKTQTSIIITDTPQQAVTGADIICTVTAAGEPVVKGEWLSPGAHLNVVGSCTPSAREVDTETILRSKLFTDRLESLFNEAGDFLIPKNEGAIAESDVRGEIGEVLTGTKRGREHPTDITLFKSLGIAAEDLYSAWHLYKKLR
ncbi:MAG TPA: ornithine cyclodeaminase family protein, partial [Puia sp.]|nr:ornithine cyclodeaminase family protein [Puia sp.]